MWTIVDPKLTSWVSVKPDCDFPIQNLPYGIFQCADGRSAVGIAIGEFVLDLDRLFEAGLLGDASKFDGNVFAAKSLNNFMALGRDLWTHTRNKLIELLDKDCPTLRDNDTLRKQALIAQSDVAMLLPVEIGDFTDFYSSKEHATNVGTMFRDANNPLLPNWLHLPVGYHGRAGTVFASGEDIYRPSGQSKADDADMPSFGPSRLLDIELEMGFFLGKSNERGCDVSTAQAPEHIFGMVLLNDWSARDIQKWEYVPLGPFLGKSFATSISPWVVTLDALAPFRRPSPKQEPAVLPYLQCEQDWAFDINLEAYLQSQQMTEPMRITRTNFKHMYWTIVQQLAHHTCNGTSMRVGDLCGSGTVSGQDEGSRGSMLEICWKGTKPLKLPTGEDRKFLQDGDTIMLRGWCEGESFRIGFGEVRATILPAKSAT